MNTITNARADLAFTEETGYAVKVTLTDAQGNIASAFAGSEALHSQNVKKDRDGISDAVCAANDKLLLTIIGMPVNDDKAINRYIDEFLTTNLTCVCSAFTFALLGLRAKEKGLQLSTYLVSEKRKMPFPSSLCISGAGRYGHKNTLSDMPKIYMVSYGYDTYQEASYYLWKCVHQWEKLLTESFHMRYEHGTGMFMPKGQVHSDEELIQMMTKIIDELGQNGKIGLGIEVDTEEFLINDSYIGLFDEVPKAENDIYSFIEKINRKYPIYYTEIDGKVEFNPSAESRKGFCCKLCKVTKADDLIAWSEKMRKEGIPWIVDDCYVGGFNVAELAVGLGATIIKGCGLGTMGNKLLQIENNL